MKCRILVLSLFVTLVINFESCDFYGNKDLGDKFTLFARDGSKDHYDIVYCSKYDIGGCVSGISVLPTLENKYSMYVKDAKFDGKWIIAKTSRMADQKVDYWIVAKRFKLNIADCKLFNCDSLMRTNITGPLNREALEKKIKIFKIQLELIDF